MLLLTLVEVKPRMGPLNPDLPPSTVTPLGPYWVNPWAVNGVRKYCYHDDTPATCIRLDDGEILHVAEDAEFVASCVDTEIDKEGR